MEPCRGRPGRPAAQAVPDRPSGAAWGQRVRDSGVHQQRRRRGADEHRELHRGQAGRPHCDGWGSGAGHVGRVHGSRRVYGERAGQPRPRLTRDHRRVRPRRCAPAGEPWFSGAHGDPGPLRHEGAEVARPDRSRQPRERRLLGAAGLGSQPHRQDHLAHRYAQGRRRHQARSGIRLRRGVCGDAGDRQGGFEHRQRG